MLVSYLMLGGFEADRGPYRQDYYGSDVRMMVIFLPQCILRLNSFMIWTLLLLFCSMVQEHIHHFMEVIVHMDVDITIRHDEL